MLKNNQNMKLVLIQDLGMQYATEKSKSKKRFGIYKCYCGKEFKTQITSVNSGNTKSCGCYNIYQIKKTKTTHGKSNHILIYILSDMKRRCNNPKHHQYHDYGGRGITICEEWKNDFMSFYNWAMSNGYEKGLSIDRIDNDKGYSPDNCRWTTRNIQARNTRRIIKANKSGYRGVSKSSKGNKWIASIGINNKSKYIGIFETPLEAAKAYDRFVKDNNLEHTRNFS